MYIYIYSLKTPMRKYSSNKYSMDAPDTSNF